MTHTQLLRTGAALFAVSALVACKPAIQAPATPAPDAAAAPAPEQAAGQVVVALDPEGLRLVVADTGSTRPLPFGSPADKVRDAVTRARAGTSPSQGTNSECGEGAMDFIQWPDLTLWFQNGAFVGWASNQPGPSTLTGIAVGATRVQLERDYSIRVEETSLGTEFGASGMSGLIGPANTVTALWAGQSCVFR